MWTSSNPSFEGKYCDFSNISFLPKPLQRPHPPIWVGGESTPALKRAASLGTCWYPIGSNPRFPLDNIERLGVHIGRLRTYAEEFDRDPAEIDLAFSANWYNLTDSENTPIERPRWFTGTASEVADDIANLEKLGVNHLVLSFQGDTTAEILDRMSEFMEKVASRL